jgi:glutathione synthase/RimK-type ligase-like ATP-grasp enzyme
MANIRIIGKRGSKSRKEISDGTGILLYTGQKVDAIINYGLAGHNFDLLLKKYPGMKSTPILNKYVGRSKYSSVKMAEKAGVLVPETLLSLPKNARISDWIEKRVNSSQGKGIIAARGRGTLLGKYYQKMIKNRRYELRVHAFSWVPKKEWAVHKRVGPPDQIAWNFHQGGHFQSIHFPNGHQVFIEAKDIAEKILSVMSMSFGAVDLIVDGDMKIYYIEINSSPGFSKLSDGIYFDAMSRLKSLSAVEVKKLVG